MKNYKVIMNKIGKEVVCLFNVDQEIVIKIEPDQEFWFAREKGGKEYRIHHSSDIARETILQANEITLEEYNSF